MAVVAACCCLVRDLRGVAVVAAVVHGGMVTTVLGLARSRGAGVVERLLNQVHGTCRGLRRGLLFFAFLNTLVPGIAKAKVPKIGIDSIFTTNFSKR